MEAWVWLVAGLVLLLAEVLTPGVFVLLFLGIGAMVTGMLALAGLMEPLWAQLASFAVLSTVSLVALRPRLTALAQGSHDHDEKLADLVGAVVIAAEDVQPQGRGRAEHRGAPWTIHNEGQGIVPAGGRAVVRGVEGLTLRVVPEQEA